MALCLQGYPKPPPMASLRYVGVVWTLTRLRCVRPDGMDAAQWLAAVHRHYEPPAPPAASNLTIEAADRHGHVVGGLEPLL